ncbi:hypothetical protein LINGRAHAP2_LOCUS5070, partial [Linum grandiflorum]
SRIQGDSHGSFIAVLEKGISIGSVYEIRGTLFGHRLLTAQAGFPIGSAVGPVQIVNVFDVRY